MNNCDVTPTISEPHLSKSDEGPRICISSKYTGIKGNGTAQWTTLGETRLSHSIS